jgi:hypothetical protein
MKPKFPLFSEVVLLEDITLYNLKRGSVGTVVEHYMGNEQQEIGYSLEGFDVPYVTIEVGESKITSVEQWHKEMEILDKLHRLSLVKLAHLEDYVDHLLSEETSDRPKVS